MRCFVCYKSKVCLISNELRWSFVSLALSASVPKELPLLFCPQRLYRYGFHWSGYLRSRKTTSRRRRWNEWIMPFKGISTWENCPSTACNDCKLDKWTDGCRHAMIHFLVHVIFDTVNHLWEKIGISCRRYTQQEEKACRDPESLVSNFSIPKDRTTTTSHLLTNSPDETTTTTSPQPWKANQCYDVDHKKELTEITTSEVAQTIDVQLQVQFQLKPQPGTLKIDPQLQLQSQARRSEIVLRSPPLHEDAN